MTEGRELGKFWPFLRFEARSVSVSRSLNCHIYTPRRKPDDHLTEKVLHKLLIQKHYITYFLRWKILKPVKTNCILNWLIGHLPHSPERMLKYIVTIFVQLYGLNMNHATFEPNSIRILVHLSKKVGIKRDKCASSRGLARHSFTCTSLIYVIMYFNWLLRN